MMALIVVSEERLYDVEQFWQDPVILNLLGLKQVSQGTTLRDDFDHLDRCIRNVKSCCFG